MNTAFLILCHRTPHYWIQQAQQWPNYHFYIHYDQRSNIQDLHKAAQLPNIHIIQQRQLIHWAGFSMVKATLSLIHTALTNPQNQHFHLVSGNCVALHPLNQLEQLIQKLPKNSLFLETIPTQRLRYRVRFNTPHADTIWQRKLSGKLLTKCYQLADLLLPTQQTAFSGSQWFSANREALQWLSHAATHSVQQFFQHKLCPDEHFFQYLITQYPHHLIHHKQNQRFIEFLGKQNHPQWLNQKQLHTLYCSPQFWFARKVDDNNALQFLQATSN